MNESTAQDPFPVDHDGVPINIGHKMDAYYPSNIVVVEAPLVEPYIVVYVQLIPHG